MVMVVMMSSILTSPSSLLPAAFYSYIPHFPSSISFSFLPYLTIYSHHHITALEKAIASEDTDLIYLVLIHLERSNKSLETFYRLIYKYPEGEYCLYRRRA